MTIPQPDIKAAQRIADKYIARDGSAPSRQGQNEARGGDPLAHRKNALLLSFLASIPAKEVHGGHMAGEAFNAACSIIGCDPRALRRRLAEK